MDRDKSFIIDLVRISAMLLVVILHVSSTYFLSFHPYWSVSLFYDNISRVSVPLFFIVSGYLLLNQDESISDFLKKRASKILLPLIVWNVFYIIIDWETWSKTSSLFGLLNTPAYFHLWFMYAIVFMYLATSLFRVFVQKGSRQSIQFIIGVWAVYACVYLCLFDLKAAIIDGVNATKSGNIDTFISMTGFYLIGGYLRRFGVNVTGHCATIILLSAFSVNFILTYKTSEYTGAPNQIFFKYFSPVVTTASVTLFAWAISSRPKLNDKMIGISSKLSTLSFGVYLVHASLLPIIFKIVEPDIFSSYSIITIPVISSIVFSLSLSITYLMKRTPVLKRCV